MLPIPTKNDSVDNGNTPPVNPQINATVSTFAGTRNPFYGQIFPSQLALDPSGNLYISDPYTNVLCKLTPEGKFSLVAGSFNLYNGGFADGKGSSAKFKYQQGIVCDSEGNVYMNDYENYRIRKITPDGVVTTIAGNGSRGTEDGVGAAASFYGAQSLTMGPDGNLYTLDNFTILRQITLQGKVTTITKDFPITEGFGGLTVNKNGDFYLACRGQHRIYKYSKEGKLSIFAGSGVIGKEDGLGTNASFAYPTGIVTDKAGNVYISDDGYNLIRKITPAGKVTTIAGNGNIGADDGLSENASFNYPEGIVIDANGNILVGESENKTIRKITVDGMVGTIYGKPDITTDVSALSAVFNQPTGVISDATNNIYIADAGYNLIRKIGSSGIVSVYAGNGSKGSHDGTLSTASFNNPTGLTIDAKGNIYVADYGNNELRKITPTQSVSSIPLFVANNGASGPNNNPSGVCVGLNGDIFYTNNSFNTICVIQGTTISTFSDGAYNDQPYGKFYLQPYGLTVDKDGNVYVADTNNHRIVKVDKNGKETIVAGASTLGNLPIAGNQNGVGMNASFNGPKGIAVDATGNLYVADSGNNCIRKITPKGTVSTIAGLNVKGDRDGKADIATFNNPTGITVNSTGTVLYVADTGNSLIRKITLE